MAESVITVLPLYHKNVAVKVRMNVEDNLDSDNFYDFWQLGGCAVVLCHKVRHISKITTLFFNFFAVMHSQGASDKQFITVKFLPLFAFPRIHYIAAFLNFYLKGLYHIII